MTETTYDAPIDGCDNACHQSNHDVFSDCLCEGDGCDACEDYDAELHAGRAAFRAEQEAKRAAKPELKVVTSNDVPAEPSSWGPVDLGPFLDGSYVAPEPTIMPREDGRFLMYAGKVHSFHGESESGKSLLLQIEAARLVEQGEDVLYVDFEDSPGDVAARLVTFGASPTAVGRHFTYVRPFDSLDQLGNTAAWRGVLSKAYALAVIDGVTDSLSLFGYSPNDNDAIAAWQAKLPRRIARETGAAVAVIDHVTKSTEGRGRFAIGGQAKVAGLDGCAYSVETDPTPRKGHRGVIVVRIGKDRPGGVRPYCGAPRGGDRTQEAARVTIDSTAGDPVVTWAAPEETEATGISSPDTKRWVRITGIMQKINDQLERAGEPKSKNALKGLVGGNTGEFEAAFEELRDRGYIELQHGPRNAIMAHQLKHFEAAFEPTVPTSTTSTSTSTKTI